MQSTCVWEERLICSNNACTSRICRKCFEGFPISSITTINPPLGEDSGSAGNDNLKAAEKFFEVVDAANRVQAQKSVDVGMVPVRVSAG